MTLKLMFLFLLIMQTTLIACENSTDYSYDEYDEEIPEPSTESSLSTSPFTPIISDVDVIEVERSVNEENEDQQIQLEKMSNTFKRIVNKFKVKHKKLEIIFLIDASSSVGEENFENEISFVKRLLSDFNVSYNFTRIALITFSSKSKIIVHVNQISDPSEDNDKCVLLNHQIPRITYSGGGTNTHSAILKGKEIFDATKRKSSKKILILITDGFSNGKSPIPIAQELKLSGVMIFTVGISSGNFKELRAISSKPVSNYNYMLSSFSLFESLARKALHTDYKVGVILPVMNDSLCDSLCDKNGTAASCCDSNSQCACGFHSGHYSCICKPGYYGVGLAPHGCEVCPNGTYWNFWNSCLNCPDINHQTLNSPALSVDECVCKTGFKETHLHRCEMIKCPLLPVPDNGYFVEGSACLNTVNTACGARCNSGYQLVGSSIRLCQEDGIWSGDETECILKTCPALSIPSFGMVVCKNPDLNITIDYSPRNESFIRDYDPDISYQTENFPTDTECEFSCAYGFHLVGSSKRHCLPLSKWDGLSASCKPILCSALPQIKHGKFNHESCVESKTPYGENCTLTCDEGFEVKGPQTKVCGGTRNGIWTPKNKIPRCIDVTPPKLVCPENYKIGIVGNESFVRLWSFNKPIEISDNSEGDIKYWAKPALKEGGTNMNAGEYRFTYVAVDEHKNKAKCNFTITIVDTTAPLFENCNENQTVLITNENEIVEWDEPMAYDNVDDKNITITRDRDFGVISPGKYTIRYTAVDQSGNENYCSIDLTVKEKKCEELEKPENGQRLCFKNETHEWCDFRCDFGFGMYQNDIMLENLVTYCDKKAAIWTIEHTPQCSLIEQPNFVEEILTISFDADHMACDDLEKNREKFMENMKWEFCGDQDCELSTDLPACVDDGNAKGASDYSYYSISKRDVDSKSVNKKKSEKIEIYVKISKNLGLWRRTSTKSENIRKVKEELKKLNSSESRLKKRLKNMNLDLTILKLDEKIICNAGSVARKLVCVQCNKGYYHDQASSTCAPCAIGAYNNLSGQSECRSCPENHSTRKIGSRAETECRQMCPPGSFARTKVPKNSSSYANGTLLKTLMPFCRSCGIGEYQPEYDQTSCHPCPQNYTSPRGSASAANCFKKFEDSCTDKTCGENGKCISSGNFYTCECDDGYYGQKCEIKHDLCTLSPCFNGGICKVVNETNAQCICSDNFVGDFCEIADEPCNLKNCQNGAECNEIGSDAICECLSGFEGDLCDKRVQIDHCSSSPCDELKSLKCVNLKDDYECKCGEGAMGKRCHLTPCDFKPCKGNSICVNYQIANVTQESYYCKCPIGLKGPECDQIDDPCEKKPCKNEARCTPKKLRDLTNLTISYEDETVFDEFSCECPPFFYGRSCELFTTPDFVLNFEKSNINNYVKLTSVDKEYKAISFCSWIQTNDHFNYGSLISYANQDSDNAFTFTDYNGFVLYVNGENVITDIKIVDDIWHFICVSWSMDEGSYEIYLDGSLYTEGKNFSKSKPIAGGGIFIIGQEQDNIGGGFSESESFVGKISFLDFWKRKIDVIEINEYYRTCDPYSGNLFSWTDLKFKTVGDIKIHQSEFCKPCQQNLTIENGNVIHGDQTGYVKCNEGFKLIGNPLIFCLRTSKWDTSNLPICKIVKCDPPKTPMNGRMSLTKTTYQGVVKFTCDEGFLLEGNESISCLSTGNWSGNMPTCKSIHECVALTQPLNGKLIYASDSGVIKTNLTAYPVGTFAEIQCNIGFEYDGDNLISCTETGEWENDIENCKSDEEATTVKEMPDDFLREFREFLYESCYVDDLETLPRLCEKSKPEFKTSLSTFEMPESPEYEGMDQKLLNLIESLDGDQMKLINIENFLEKVIKNHIESAEIRDAYRFLICLYIDLILMDKEIGAGNFDDSSVETINDKIKKSLESVIKVAYQNSDET